MTEHEESRFAQVSALHNEFLTIDEEPRNPLLDAVDDPLLADLTEEQARVESESLLVEFGDVLCDELPGVLPPFRPVNHHLSSLIPRSRLVLVRTPCRTSTLVSGLLIVSSTCRAGDGVLLLWIRRAQCLRFPRRIQAKLVSS